MSFWNEAFWFQRRGDRYIYRPNVFSAGYDVSADEKDALFRGLKRAMWWPLLDGSIVFVVGYGAVVIAGGTHRSGDPALIVAISIPVIAAMLAAAIWRRRRLVSRVLGGRRPDVPRMPFGRALAQPRPMIERRYSVPVLQSAGILIGLATVTCDGVVGWLIYSGYRAGQVAQGAAEVAAVERFASLTLYNPAFWLAVALFNAITVAAILFAFRQARRIRGQAGNT